jgi:uncharacterized iron-regulated protein
MPLKSFAPLAAALLVGCGDPLSLAETPEAGSDAPTKVGKTFSSAAEAPQYEGMSFKGMHIYDLEADVYLDEAALLETLDDSRLVFFGEQHETAPVQELELWLLQRMTTRYPDVSLAMEHFQHDEQPVVDNYLAGAITTADFEKTSQPWKTYAQYWKPLVEHMKAAGRPVIALNVPDEALQMLYAKYPTTPLNAFNAWDASFKYDQSVAPRPLAIWDATYKSYFEASFDYEAHGKKLGMTYADALNYFTDLALIRDETFGYFVAQGLKNGGRVMTVAGDWHVQTGLATPDRALRYSGSLSRYDLVTSTTSAKLETLRNESVSGRKLARFVLVYETR